VYKLYYSPGACSLAIHALLLSLSVPFDTVLIDANKGDNRSTDYLKLNPRGQVPVLVMEGHVIRESAVIATYLANKHQSALLPKDEFQRLKSLEWLGFYNSSLHQAYGAYFLLTKNMREELAKEAACELVARRINFLWREVEAHLKHNRTLAGDDVTLPDLFHTVIAHWSGAIRHPIKLGPNIRRLCHEVADLSYFQQALQAEGIQYSLGGD